MTPIGMLAMSGGNKFRTHDFIPLLRIPIIISAKVQGDCFIPTSIRFWKNAGMKDPPINKKRAPHKLSKLM